MYSNITPELLINETHNFYGVKATLAAAVEYLSQHVYATPGSFLDWIRNHK